MSGSVKSAELATSFEQAHREVMAFAQACPTRAWATVTNSEKWPVGVVLSHVAEGYASAVRWLGGYLEGRPVPDTRALIDEANAAHAAAAAQMPREATIEALRSRGERALETIRALSDEQLAISHPMEMAGGAQITAQQLVEILVRHTSRHLESCREAVGG